MTSECTDNFKLQRNTCMLYQTPLKLGAILCHFFLTMRSTCLCGMPCKALDRSHNKVPFH